MTILRPGCGWAQYFDGVYSSGSPQVISGRTKLELDAEAVGGQIIETDLGRGYSRLWDSTNDLFLPHAEGDAYDIRLTFTFERTIGSDDHIDVELDVGGSLGVIWEQIIPRVKTDQRHSVSIPIFTGATFLANKGTFYLDSNGSTFNVWGTQIFVLCHYSRVRRIA